jgi:hypothetical protein
MNNTMRTLAIVAVLMAATLVVGTAGPFLTTTKTVFAASNNSGNTVTGLAAQNRGSASGFDTAVDQESQNVICTHPSDNATCTKEGVSTSTSTSAATPPTPTPRPTCVECFTNLVTQGLLTQDQIDEILKVLNKTTVADLCAALQNGTVSMTALADAIEKVVQNTTTSTKLLTCIGEKGE